MPERTHITVSVWNYCNNNCKYCVAESNKDEWQYKSNFETFSPNLPSDDDKNDLQLRVKYGENYYHKMCPDFRRYLNKKDVLDYRFLVHWLTKNKPGAIVYLSGGEPLLRPDIVEGTKMLLQSGFKVVMMTNGMLIPKHPELLELPIAWIIAHHQQNPIDKWLKAVEPIKWRPHIATAVQFGDTYDNPQKYEPAYKGFNFFWRRCRGGFIGMKLSGPTTNVATDFMNLINPDGRVWPCNSQAFGTIGHIYTGEYNPENGAAANEHVKQCVKASHCGAYQTALMIENLI
jgi:organic radical activating enzyme